MTLRQNALTVVAEIKPKQAGALNDILTALGTDPAGNPKTQLGNVSSLHFCAFVILDKDPAYPDYLAFECNYDGDLGTYLDELVVFAHAGLDALYAHFVDYPENATPDQLKAYLRQHAQPTAAYYVGCRGQTVGDIKNAIAVRQEIENFLDAEQARRSLDGLSAQAILARIQAHLNKPGVESPKVSSETLSMLKSRSRRNLLLLALVGVPLVLLTLPLLLIWLVLFRRREILDNRAQPLPPLPVDPRNYLDPDIRTQSHLTTLVSIKAGPVRQFTLRGVLALARLVASTVSIYGNLVGIPTIHFARWLLIDHNKRLLFFSNYDGSWASYLGDFVDKAKYGLTAVWGNTTRFPPSNWLALGGAAYFDEFKAWSRQHNFYAPLFYRAYPSATIANLLTDIDIRDNVGRSMSEAEAADFLQRF